MERSELKIREMRFYTKYDGNKNELVRVEAKTYNEFKATANILSSSTDYRMLNCTDGDYPVKERVTFLEAMTDMPQK